ncbi:hypothetical protein QTG54_005654 [Skeletonema marinoi]|uniref:WRKY transcription factor 19 n=1 Tax=Skeletonema marinoi TaxID=267567 RepID=A0AAD9DEB8_9STRA|nr:hypothetical protein QTG54_005654 [Skeletonema marinoi]
MPTAIKALVRDGSGGLTGELREHELCAFSYDSSDEPTEVIVLIKNEAGDESSKEDRAGASKSIDPLLNGSESSSAPPVMDKSPYKNMTKTDFGLTYDNNNAKLTRQHVLLGAGSKKNTSPQKEVSTRSFAPLGCTKAALFGSGGGSNNPSFCTSMNDAKDTSGEKAIEGAVVSGGSHDQAIKARVTKEGDGKLFRDVKERGKVMDTSPKEGDDGSSEAREKSTDVLMEKTTSDESSTPNYTQGRELDEFKSALSNHTSALLMLLRQTAAKGEKCVPAVLLNPVREETMTALRNAHFRFPLSSALSDAENRAVRLYTEEITQRKKERQQREQRLETMNDGSADNEGQCGTKSVLASASVNNDDLLAGVTVTSKRPRSDKGSENGQVKKRRLVTYRCSSEGCKNNAVKGGVCWRHGAKKKLCSSDGCTNHAKKGGVCWRHGAKIKLCSSEGCTNHVQKGGV